MIRISNRNYAPQNNAGPQVQHIEHIIEVKAPDAIIQYIDREIIREIPVAGETIVMSQPVDLQPLHDKHAELDTRVQAMAQRSHQLMGQVGAELEMQRRALVAIKMQRDVDRSRRLMLIKRIRKEKKKAALFLKLGIGASLLVSILTLIIKL